MHSGAPPRVVNGLGVDINNDIKNKGEDGFSKGIDLKAVHLLFAAAKIVHNSISAAHDELAYDAETMVAQAIVAKEKATKYVKHCTL
uniref:Uncharacterized protein n=1 Tax=Tanacetum cinerariifolium TaxID=118510 RepID=A0A6L2NKP1_TANCI|nr:hypothetical protein [Tanacetum cinerariifolium]GEV52206.1 hypothetical protein [Tanacetum cinerariifolium]